ncbi:WG repeat-containing protein [Massilia aquatica]|uniref:WG repeat-containing protein n=1 Tax=Massilia aquatica TaxID=2609000 RepID=A0ABX0M8U9_9BURK|nr:WG repeat-containing protein [Massilia aquatica]NHZ41440.1 WG repeat-containing protein [Massilia aquatica]
MTIQPTLIRNYFAPQGLEPELLLLHGGQVHVPVPALGDVFGEFVGDGQGGAIAAAMAGGGMCGYIDTQGAWVVAPTLDDARTFSADGLACFCDQGKWGYLDVRGKVVIEPQYAQGEPFQHGLAAVQTAADGWRYIDTSGKFAFDDSFANAGSFTAGGLAAARIASGPVGYIDRSGAWAIAPRFASAQPFSRDGVAPASEDGKRFGIIDRKGAWVLEPRYDRIDDFNADGLAFFKHGWNDAGYLDTTGAPVIVAFNRLSESMHCGIAIESAHTCMTAQGKLAFDAPLLWCGDFNEHGFAIACARAAQTDSDAAPVWGIARADGSFARPPADVLEPLTQGRYHDIATQEANTPLVAFLARDASIAFLDRDACVAWRLRAEPAPGGAGPALYDAAGRLLWHGQSHSTIAPPALYFSAPPESLLIDLHDLGDLAGLADSMVLASANKLCNIDAALQAPASGDEDEEDHCTLPGDRNEYGANVSAADQLAKSLRTRRRIFRSYLDEHKHAAYEFFASTRGAVMDATYARCVARLTEHLGPSTRNPGKSAPPDITAWGVPITPPLAGLDAARPGSNQMRLVLFTQAGYGDGDVWHNIWLVCSPSIETLAAAHGGRVPTYPSYDDDDYDDDDEDDEDDDDAPAATAAS